MSADRRARIINILGVEGMMNKAWAEANENTEPDTEVWIAEWEYELWDDE